MAERVICPGCGNALNLEDNLTLVTCPFCDTKSRIVRKLRRAEPRFSWEIQQPEKKPEPGTPPSQWSLEELLACLNDGDRPDLHHQITQAMDSWSRVSEENLKWLPPLMMSLPHWEPELALRAAGIIGKYLCSDKRELRHKVLQMLPEFLLLPRGCEALLKVTALADAAAVRMLLDTARHACAQNDLDYAKAAMLAIQTAIGRERNERKTATCLLIHQIFDVHPFMAEWILTFLRYQFDVGYTDFLGETLEVLDDALHEREDLVEGLLKALKKCSRPKSSEDLALRISACGFLRHPTAREEALKTITPPYPLKQEDVDRVMQSFCLMAGERLVADSLSKFIWNGEYLHPEHLAQLESQRPLPQSLEQALDHYRKTLP